MSSSRHSYSTKERRRSRSPRRDSRSRYSDYERHGKRQEEPRRGDAEYRRSNDHQQQQQKRSGDESRSSKSDQRHSDFGSRRHHHDDRRSSQEKRNYQDDSNGSSRRYDDRKHEDRKHDSRYDDRRYYEDRRYDDEESLEPNINVVLRGLPDHAGERDIEAKLTQMEASIDDVSLIKDRDTGESRKFAFIRFTSVGHAIQFVEKHRSFNMDSYRVRVDYCHKNKSNEEKEEWRCSKCGIFNVISRRVCVECRQSFIVSAAEKRTNETETMAINDGSKDISYSPSNMLLVRQLDNLSSEESVYSAMAQFQGVHRVILIRDKLTKMSCEFTFIEFVNVQYAATALQVINQGFEMDRRPVSASYANPDSFLPVYDQSEWSIPANVEDALWAYWDKGSYASEYSPAIEAARKQREEEIKLAKEAEQKKAQQAKNSLEDDLSAFYADMGDFAGETNDIFAVPKI